jgi:hypothetical protein
LGPDFPLNRQPIAFEDLMTRLVLIASLAASIGILGCGEAGMKTRTRDSESVSLSEADYEATPQRVAQDEATLQRAREDVLARIEQVRARNAAKREQYEKELEEYRKVEAKYDQDLAAFKKAKADYDSLRALDFALKNFTAERLLAGWYSDIVSKYPGSDACKEAQRRLAGETPKSLPVPPLPGAPPIAPKAPAAPQYESEPSITDLETPQTAVAGTEGPNDPPLACYDMSKRGTGLDIGKVWVRGYRRRDGQWVEGHWRNPPGAGPSPPQHHSQNQAPHHSHNPTPHHGNSGGNRSGKH